MARKNIKRPRLNSRKRRKLRVWQEQAREAEAQEQSERILRTAPAEMPVYEGVRW